MILLIDNYDSFTYNLVQRLGEIDAKLDIQVHRNNKISVEEIEQRKPTHLIIPQGHVLPMRQEFLAMQHDILQANCQFWGFA